MELKEEINITRQLLKKLADDAWVSFKGTYGFYNYFVNAKFDRLDFIEEKMEQGILSPEEKQQYLNEVANIHNVLKTYEGKELKDKIVADTVQTIETELGELPTNSDDNKESDMNLDEAEIDELLSSLDDNKLETTYPTEDFSQDFVPLDLPDIPSDNPIQPGDIEKSVNLPK